MSYSFSGGIYLETNRDKTCRKNLLVYDSVKSVKIPLFSAGFEFEPVVAPGDHVRMGQVIGTNPELEGFEVRASVSGTVTNISDIMAKDGRFIKCVEVENDFQNEFEPLKTSFDSVTMTPDEINAVIRAAGIVENGTAIFRKIENMLPYTDTLIIDAIDSEPWICSSYRTLCDHADDIVEGIRTIARMVPRLRAFIALCDEYTDALTSVRRAVGSDSRMHIVCLNDKYPQNDEKLLIYTVTGNKCTDDPAASGTLVLSAQTAAEIGRAMRDGMPALTRIITVGGEAVANPRAVEVPIGTDYHELAALCGGYLQTPARIIAGGLMRGTEVFTDEFPVSSDDSALTAILSASSSAKEECIHCGRCTSVCPYSLMPGFINYFVEQGLTQRLSGFNIRSCTYCGACAYICPAHINLVQVMRRAANIESEQNQER